MDLSGKKTRSDAISLAGVAAAVKLLNADPSRLVLSISSDTLNTITLLFGDSAGSKGTLVVNKGTYPGPLNVEQLGELVTQEVWVSASAATTVQGFRVSALDWDPHTAWTG